ncbi:MAG: radical SAM protein [Planctomycetes bacterium]|nr:radical SAM protein [Planctomycetota bacterium]
MKAPLGGCESLAANLTVAALAARSARKPTVVIDVTGNCNLRCEHCWNVGYLGSELPKEEILALIGRIPGQARVHLLGGDPLLHPALPEIVRFAADRGHYTSLVTNGVALSCASVEGLLDSGLAEIGISLDGPDAQTHDAIRGAGSFDRGWAALERTSRAIQAGHPGTMLTVSATAMQMNLPHLPRLVERLGTSGIFVDIVVVAFGYAQGRAKAAGRLDEGSKGPVDPAAWLGVAEEICRAFKRHPRLQHLNLRAPPLVHEFLTTTTGVYLLDSVTGCPALDAPFGGRVTSDGRVYSCGRDFLIERARAAGLFPHEGLHHASLVAQGREPFGQAGFRDVLENHRRHPRVALCESCRWKIDCLQCPILSCLGEERGSALCRPILDRYPDPATWRRRAASEPAGEAPAPEGTLRLSPDVYDREARDGRVLVLSVDLDRAVEFTPGLHAGDVVRSARAGLGLAAARAAYQERHPTEAWGHDEVADRLVAEGLASIAFPVA